MSLYESFVGKYVICRSRNEGLNAGVVKAADETGVILGDVRRLWYYKPRTPGSSWYEAVANSGLDSSSKISETVREKLISEDYSLTVCASEAEASIRGMKPHEN